MGMAENGTKSKTKGSKENRSAEMLRWNMIIHTNFINKSPKDKSIRIEHETEDRHFECILGIYGGNVCIN